MWVGGGSAATWICLRQDLARLGALRRWTCRMSRTSLGTWKLTFSTGSARHIRMSCSETPWPRRSRAISRGVYENALVMSSNWLL